LPCSQRKFISIKLCIVDTSGEFKSSEILLNISKNTHT
jgi:hypothetical protein